MQRHDPLMVELSDDELERRARALAVIEPARPGLKWCCCPQHPEALREAAQTGDLNVADIEQASLGWMPVNEFSPDDRYADGVTSWCKPCEAYRKRQRRRDEAEQAGRTVRPYERR